MASECLGLRGWTELAESILEGTLAGNWLHYQARNKLPRELVVGVDMFVSAVSPTISSLCTGSVLRDPVSGKSHLISKCPWDSWSRLCSLLCLCG